MSRWDKFGLTLALTEVLGLIFIAFSTGLIEL